MEGQGFVTRMYRVRDDDDFLALRVWLEVYMRGGDCQMKNYIELY